MPAKIPHFESGASLDIRPEEKKLKDYKFEELVASVNPVVWVEKPKETWRRFPIFNQNGSGSCVAQTLAKLLGILYWLKNKDYVHFSATHIYQQRSNKPQGGMNGVEAFDIATNGVTLEELVPSKNMTDEQMDNIFIPPYKKEVGTIFKIPNYVVVSPKDIDSVASIIQTTGKGVMVWFYFKIDEWTEQPVVKYPTLNLVAPDTARHSVTAVDFTLYNGKKALIIEDSWGTTYGLAGQRIIDEDFFKERNWFAAYPIAFKFDEQSQSKPKHIFTKILEFGQTNSDIKILQDILKYEGLFPSNASSTGYYGSITATAILKWQIKHSVAPLEELNSLAGRRVGNKTLGKLNEIYA